MQVVIANIPIDELRHWALHVLEKTNAPKADYKAVRKQLMSGQDGQIRSAAAKTVELVFATFKLSDSSRARFLEELARGSKSRNALVLLKSYVDQKPGCPQHLRREPRTGHLIEKPRVYA